MRRLWIKKNLSIQYVLIRDLNWHNDRWDNMKKYTRGPYKKEEDKKRKWGSSFSPKFLKHLAELSKETGKSKVELIEERFNY